MRIVLTIINIFINLSGGFEKIVLERSFYADKKSPCFSEGNTVYKAGAQRATSIKLAALL
jgi:hypothetical protein